MAQLAHFLQEVAADTRREGDRKAEGTFKENMSCTEPETRADKNDVQEVAQKLELLGSSLSTCAFNSNKHGAAGTVFQGSCC